MTDYLLRLTSRMLPIRIAIASRYFCLMFAVLFVMTLVSCSNGAMLNRLERIQNAGDEDPVTALAMLDSLESEVRSQSEYVKSRYDLLRIRLNDKAYNMPSSDADIKRLMSYFESHGDEADKQQVYYYAGSVYRDMQDGPQAIVNFYKSLDYGCDSIMLRNAYSQLNDLFYNVQNYQEAISMAEKELEVRRKLGNDLILPYMHLATAYIAMNEFEKTTAVLDTVYRLIIDSNGVSQHQEDLYYLLCDYSKMGELSKAKDCFSLIESDPLKDFTPFTCCAFAQYYRCSGKLDSAAIYCDRVLADGTNIYNMYDAAKMLYGEYLKNGDAVNALKYATKYMELSDSLDFGKRQELAATVNNQYKYHLDQRKELDNVSLQLKLRGAWLTVALVLLVALALVHLLWRYRSKLRAKEAEYELLKSDLYTSLSSLEQMQATIGNYENTIQESASSKVQADKIRAILDDQIKVVHELIQSSYELDESKFVNKFNALMTMPDDDKTASYWTNLQALTNDLHDDVLVKAQEMAGGKLTENEINLIALLCCGYSRTAIMICLKYKNIITISNMKAKIAKKLGIPSLDDFIRPFHQED